MPFSCTQSLVDLRSSQGIGKACGQLKSRGVTSEDMAVILDVHNKLRAKVANGQEHRGQIYQQPPAANMRQLVSELQRDEV